MIISMLLNVLYGITWVILTPIRLLPDVTVNSTFASAIVTAIGYYAILYSIAPTTITAIVTTLLFIILIEVAIIVYKIIMWFIRRLPTQS